MSTIVTRAAKGSALSFAEMDNNLTNLNNDKLEKDIQADLSTTYGVSVKNTSDSFGPLKYFIAFYNYLGTLIGGISHDALENVGLTSKNGIKLGTGTSGTTRVEIDSSGNTSLLSSGALKLNAGTTAQRPTGTTGQIRFNTDLGKPEVFNGSYWGSVGGGATGSGGDEIFIENGQTITTNYTIGPNKNAGTFGPVTVADGVSVTVSDGCVWTVV